MYYHKHCHHNQYPKLDEFNLKKIKFYVLIHYLNMNVIREIDGAQCDHFLQFYNRSNVKVHIPIIRWSHCVEQEIQIEKENIYIEI